MAGVASIVTIPYSPRRGSPSAVGFDSSLLGYTNSRRTHPITATSGPHTTCRPRVLVDSSHGEDTAHPVDSQVGVTENAGAVGEDEQLRQVDDGPGALEPAHQAEVRLVTIEVGGEDHARLVEPGRRLEDVTGER